MSEKPKFNPYAIAYEQAEYLGLKKGDEESDEQFKTRVAGVLRRNGFFIEAHEVRSGRRCDDPQQDDLTGPMAGIIGAMAQIVRGREYSPNDPERQVGDDIVMGGLIQGRRGSAESAMEEIFEMLGPEAGMSIVGALKGRR
jgi:hypothetical protein